jgi:hypothetical protein
LFDLVRKCIVEETEDGYKLTPYGYELIEEKL